MKKTLIILLVVIVVGALAWFFRGSLLGGSMSLTASVENAVHNPNSKEYSDTAFHFALQYPEDLDVHIYDEDDGSRTITFEGETPGIGFQVFVVPYTDSVITQERFNIDDPSGVMNDPQDIKIAEVPAKIFFGHNDQMGDTREVWFVHNGFLYEVTTYKTLDTWLPPIMETWKFI